MRKMVVLFSLLVLFLANVIPVLSQTSNGSVLGQEFDTAYTNYVAKLDEYKRAHEEYILRRSQYLSFKTLKSQQDAQVATAKMLILRDEVVTFYLSALKAKLKDARGISSERYETLSSKINGEMSWFSDHRSKVSSQDTLTNLVSDSEEANAHYQTIEPFFYEILTTISSGKLTDFNQRLKEVLTEIKEKVEKIKKDQRPEFIFSSRKTEIIDRWISESEERINVAEENQKQVEALISSLLASKNQRALVQRYNNILEDFIEPQSLLKDSASYLKEVIREVKTAED